MRATVPALVLLIALLVSGCGADREAEPDQRSQPPSGQTGSPAGAGLVGSLVTVRPEDPPAGRPRIGLLAARGEAESFQVVIDGGTGGAEGVKVELLGPLQGQAGEIAASQLSLFSEPLVELDEPSDIEGEAGRWPDPLVPAVDPFYGEVRNAFPISVPAGESRAVWADLQIPGETRPGVYAGTIAVSGEGLGIVELGLEVRVIPLLIDAQPTLPSAFDIRPEEICLAHAIDCVADPAAGWSLLALYARAALDNRIGPSHLALSAGTARDRALFRRHMLPLIQGRPLPGEDSGLLPARLPGARPARIEVTLPIEWWRREAERGGFARRAFAYPCDEPDDDEAAWEACRIGADAARAAWPGVDVLITASFELATRFGSLDRIDLLTTLVNELGEPPGASASPRPDQELGFFARGGRQWAYNACPSHGCEEIGGADAQGWPSYVIDQPASQQRAMGLLAIRYRLEGELYYALNRRLAEFWDRPSAFSGNGDGDLFYPGTPERIGGSTPIPIESIRTRRIRDGREDHAWLTALIDSGRARAAYGLLRRLLPDAQSATINPARIADFRRRAAELLSPAAPLAPRSSSR